MFRNHQRHVPLPRKLSSGFSCRVCNVQMDEVERLGRLGSLQQGCCDLLDGGFACSEVKDAFGVVPAIAH